jgi:hypothetical protein
LEHAYRVSSSADAPFLRMAFATPLGADLKRILFFFLLPAATAFALHATTYYVTVTGLGGEPEYVAQFARWAGDLDRQLKLNGPDARVETLSGATATRQHARETLTQLANQITPDDAFALFLIGHGSFDGTEYKLNVPGPDITAEDLREWLSHIKASRQLVVDMTSCSGAAMPSLAAKNRIVVTATKSGNEKNATVFPRYFIDAFHDPSADTDKNGVITALEAFHYAQLKVTEYFTSEKLIATEHALFSDTGSANAVRDPGPANQQGLLASAFPLLRPPTDIAVVTANPAKQRLISHKDELEAQIDRLKYQKASLPENEYKQQLTVLLLELARTQAEIDK